MRFTLYATSFDRNMLFTEFYMMLLVLTRCLENISYELEGR